MEKKSWLYKATVWAVTLGLLLQSFPFWLGLNRPRPVLAEAMPAVTPPGALNNQPIQPDALVHPISISRVQSTYQAGGTAVITYTVTNNQRPLNFPELADSATITETAQSLADIDINQDLNTIQNVVVTNQFLNDAAVLSASNVASFDGSRYLWNLGHIAPQQSRQLTVTLQLPPSTNDFVDLDSGAAVHASWRGRLVSHQAWPATVVPDDLAQWLISTPDANLYDKQMLAQVGNLTQSPEALFAFVQAMGYEAYAGSLRGTRGTLWSQAGNSLDQSSLLIAMLRSSGIPARYRHGTLSTTDTQMLILSMFPSAYDTLGYIPPQTATSDPANDPALLALVQDHWWVEAYLPGTGWTDLDPSFATAVPGDSFATPANDGTDRIAELPAALRHTVTLSVEVELYNSFPIGGPNLSRSTPLVATYNSVSLAGLPVNLGYFVDTQSQGGLVYSNHIHTYTPYFRLGQSDSYLSGDPFQEVLTNFPLATTLVTGVWLTIERNHPDGQTTSYIRELKDLIGPDVRQFGGQPELPPRGAEPLLGQGDVAQLQVIPHSRMPATELTRLQADNLAIAPEIAQAALEIEQLSDDDLTQNLDYLYQHFETVEAGQMLTLEMLGAMFQVVTSAPEYQLSEEALLVKSYPQEPKLLLLSQQVVSDTLSTTFELLNIEEKALAYPGQSMEAAAGATLMRTMSAKEVEYRIMQQLADGNISSPFATFNQAQAEGVPMTLITNANLDELAQLPISGEAQARILQAVYYHDLTVIVPNQMIAMPDGETIAWLEYDATGNASYVAEDGLRAAAASYALKVTQISWWAKKSASFGGFVFTIVYFIADVLKPDPLNLAFIDLGKPKDIYDHLSSLKSAVEFGKMNCDTLAAAAAQDCLFGVILAATAIAAALGLYYVSADPSLPETHFAIPPSLLPPTTISGTVTAVPSHAAVTIEVDAATDHLVFRGETAVAWQSSHTTGLILETATAANAILYDGDTLLDSGALQISQPTAATLMGSAAVDLAGEGHLAFYAPATPGLAGGSHWLAYTVQLNAPAPYTLALNQAVVAMNGTVYTGDLQAVIDGSALVNGRLHSPLPHFQSDTVITSQTANLTLGPLAGTVLAGSEPVEAVNGLAVAGFAGPVALAEVEPTLDQVSFGGPADWFTLNLESSTAALNPTEELIITPVIQANFADTYTLTVDLPLGWAAAVSGGQIAATPPANAAMGQHVILVSAQSSQYPDLVVSALVEAEITPYSNVTLTIAPDPLLTIPMGEVLDPDAEVSGYAGHLPNGRAEIPNAAYIVTLKNESTSGRTFDLNVSGLPVGWTLLSGVGQAETATLVLGPGQQRHLGLYVSPTEPGLLAAGTSYPFVVTAVAQDDPILSDSVNTTFTMPGVAFPYPQLAPEHQFVTVGDLAAVSLAVTNVGNVAGSFPVTVTMHSSIYSSAALSPTWLITAPNWQTGSLAPGQSAAETVVLTTTGAIPGRSYFLLAETAAGEYRPQAVTAVTVVSLNAGPIFIGSQQAATSCPLNEPAFSAALYSLALAVTDLEIACDSGDCPPALRDQAVAAAQQAATYGRLASPLVQTYTELETAAAELANATTNTAILDALPGITTAVTTLITEVCAISRHRPTLRLTPWLDAALPGQTASYNLALTNRGTLTTTYAVTVTLPAETLTFQQTIAPGATENMAIPAASDDLGLYLLTAEVKALDAPIDYLTAQAEARLNVVDRFVQVTQVTADPPFVETGESSTTLQIEVANIAGIGLSSEVETAVFAPSGAEMWSGTIPLNILGGAPRLYDLAELDTSGWDSGVYTITANLLLNDAATTGGEGYGYFSVGQAVIPSHAVHPELVAPGTVTVTTSITTEINQGAVNGNQYAVNGEQSRRHTIYDAPYWDVQELANRPFINVAEASLSEPSVAGPPPAPVTEIELAEETAVVAEEEELRPLTFTHPELPAAEEEEVAVEATVEEEAAEEETAVDLTEAAAHDEISADHLPATLMNFPPAFTRLEQDDPAFTYTGSWGNINLNRASGGSIWRNGVAGGTAELAFDGAWVTVGFIGNVSSGYAEIFINGDSQGIVDLYRREETAVSLTYDGLPLASHTISVTVTGDRNPFANNQFIHLDYIEFGDGSDLPHGQFEQDDERVILSGGWTNVNYANASGGSYVRATAATAWFPFAGDSFSLHGLAYNGGGYAHLYIDGRYLDSIDFYHPNSATNAITRTFSYDGFGPGPHLLQITTYRNNTTIDALQTPGQPPFADPNPPPGSFNRYEEDQPAILYNGVPYTQTTTSWSRQSATAASDSQYMRSLTTNDTIGFDFDGDWLNVGFIGGRWGGYVEISLNGDSQGLFDLYRRDDNTPVNFVFADLGAGPHTVTMTVTGDRNPFSLGTWVQLDYIDYWDGAPLGDGLFEEDDERALRSGGWTDVTFTGASGGSYMRGSAVTAWFPFDGDSFTYHALAYNAAGYTHLYVDGHYLDTVDLYHTGNATNAITRTFSYDGFGPGPHILQIQSYRSQTTIDALQTPGQPPFTDPDPAPGSINRYEEDHPAIRYNGAPYTQMPQSWSRLTATTVSDGQYMRSHTAGDTIGFDFEGSWLNLGFYGDRFSGYAEIFIDGDSQGVVDLYRREDGLINFFFPDLTPGSHTVTVTVLGDGNSFVTANRVQFDYLDFGDGTGLDHGTVEEDDGRILRAGSWVDVANADASDGGFIRSSNGNLWLYFEGDSFTYQAMAYNLANRARLYVNGHYLDTVDLYHPNSLTNAITRTFSYEGFGPGPHLLQISAYRGQTTLDAITTPGIGPFIDPNPPVTGITRFEEDHPAVRYNGVPFTQTASSWSRVDTLSANRASDGQYIHSSTVGDTISFDFEGGWIGVGFATNRFSGQAEIAIDGNVTAVVDLYTREDDTKSVYFSDLGEGSHTITITLLSTHHPNSTNNQLYLDYFDVWDGQPLAEGQFEETDERIFYSGGWSQLTNADASGGAFASSGTSDSTAWFPFTGDSITFQSWTFYDYHSVDIRIDGVSQGHFDTYSRLSGPRSFSFEGLGDGPHVLEVRRYRGSVTVDAFITPATGDHYQPPTPNGIIRLEEDHPDLRYNGYPHRYMPQSWSTQGSLFRSSDKYHTSTGTAGNTLSLEFEGSWVGAGFSSGGMVEIFIDGESQGVFDTAAPDELSEVSSFYFGDLISGTHVISITAVSGAMRPDFIDIWDGQPVAEGWHNARLEDESGRFHYSNRRYWGEYTNQYAYEGDFVAQNLVNVNPNFWFTFVGSDLTILSFNRAGSSLHITIDGDYLGEFDMTAAYSNQPYALHFPDLGDGPHVVHIHTRGSGRIDAFEVNPAGFYSYTPQIIWHDDSAKEELDPAFRTGFLTTIGIGDLNGDGNVELVAPGVNGRLYVYRGDGQDTGDGTPLLWTSDLVGVAAEPALADLTGDGAAEIIVSGYHGLFAFRHDGQVLWHEESIKAYSGDIGGLFGWGGPTVGNLDNDPHPEIVIAASEDALYVLDHQGNILDSDPIGRWPSVPVLADISGDNTLDIIVAQGHTLKVYDYNPLDGLDILWTYTLTDTTLRSGAFGSPAVADLTGDGQPEIIINWGHRVEAFQTDGSLLWSYYTGDDLHYRPSPITVADVTGDGEVNIITASAINAGFQVWDHMLMVLTADGNLVWEQEVADRTASASGVAAQDLTGNGVWEILWNGSHDGFLILRGHDGKRLFNEPFTGSGTIMEYPTLGDVDGDGVADVVLAGREGIFVISHIGRWVNSRPLWNQHNYHVTNINDDWSVPLTQPNSWELHNTYRTQTPEQNPAPSYRVEITHTVGVSNVTVLTDTFSTPPAGMPPEYHWAYQLEWYAPVNTITFTSQLANMQPGETRQINNGTEVGYRLPSGWNYLTLPPLYVTAARILEISPDEQIVGVGTTAVYTLTLLNPGLNDDLYNLDIDGLPADWLSYPAQVNVPAQSSIDVLLEVATSSDAELYERPFLVNVTTGSGGQDMTTASLALFNGLQISIDPSEQTAPTGTAVTYTLTLTNSQLSMVSYQLSTTGLAQVDLPDEIELGPETAVSFPITVTSSTAGPQPFSVTAEGDGGSNTANAVLTAVGQYAVGLALDPDSNVAGPATPALFDLIVTNLGDTADGYDLSLNLPPGWSAALDANGTPVDQISLPPHVFNSTQLRLLITPDLAAAPGDYDFNVTAVSQTRPGVQATITGTVEVLPLGVQVAIAPPQTTMSPLDDGLWQVTITNTGSVADSFDLTAAGIISLTASFSQSSVTLGPGQAQTVQMSSGPLPFALPQSYPFWVMATAQSDERIRNADEASVTFTGYEGVEVAWLPAGQTVTNTLSASFMLVITNTGNVLTLYQVELAMPGLSGQLLLDELPIPARSTAALPLTVYAGGPGMYELTAVIQSSDAIDSATATLTIVLDQANQPPVVTAGPDRTVIIGSAVSGILATFIDPDAGDAHTAVIDWGDGTVTAGIVDQAAQTVSGSHSFAAVGTYTVTVTVTDNHGGVGSDTLQIAVSPNQLYLPVVLNNP